MGIMVIDKSMHGYQMEFIYYFKKLLLSIDVHINHLLSHGFACNLRSSLNYVGVYWPTNTPLKVHLVSRRYQIQFQNEILMFTMLK